MANKRNFINPNQGDCGASETVVSEISVIWTAPPTPPNNEDRARWSCAALRYPLIAAVGNTFLTNRRWRAPAALLSAS